MAATSLEELLTHSLPGEPGKGTVVLAVKSSFALELN